MSRKAEFVVSYLVCPECEGRVTVPRKKKRLRERDHVKTMWCPFCKKMRDFVEKGDYK